MKSIIRIALILLLITNHQLLTTLNAQISINEDGSSPDASAMLDIKSTDKGILIPRMDSTSRMNISNPATGLMVFDSTTYSFWFYANSTWNNLNSTFLEDNDGDTKIQVEESSDEDIIRFDLGGTEFMRLDSGRIEILNTGGSVFIGEDAGENDDFTSNNNVFIGNSAGYSNEEGAANVFVGNTAGRYSVNGNYNIFTGHRAGYANNSGDYNIFTGYFAGFSNGNGDHNIFSGSSSGTSNQDGDYNIFSGYQSGKSNQDGSSNIYLGYQAGYSNKDGDENIFIGYKAGYSETGSNKLYIDNSNSTTPLIYGDFDADSLQINGTLNINGNYNFPTTDGDSLQILMTNGDSTVSWAYLNLLSDSDNDTKIQVEESSDEDIIRFDLGGTEYFRMNNGRISVVNTGYSIFLGNNTGVNDDFTDNANVFIGNSAGRYNTSGEYNIYIGNQSGNNNTTGYKNVFLGYSAGKSNLTGYHNLSLGYQAGFSNDGSNNVFLGYQAGYNETSSDKLYIENSDATSPLIYGEFDNDRIVINGNSTDNSNNRTLFVNGSIGATSAFNNDSDRRLKTDIQTIPNALNKVLEMRGVTYQWKDGRETGDRMGFIAQEVEPILPEVVDNKNDHYTMQYAPITAVLIEAVKEQQGQINELKSENEQLKIQLKKINQLEAKLEALSNSLN